MMFVEAYGKEKQVIFLSKSSELMRLTNLLRKKASKLYKFSHLSKNLGQ